MLPLSARAADDDFKFDPTITEAEFSKFSRLIGTAIFATPVAPARSGSIIGFDIGVAANGVKVDTSAPYWRKAVGNDFSTNGYAAVPRLVVMKGFGSGTISGSYAKVQNSDASILGGALDLPILRGSLVSPELAVRASYSQLSGVDVYSLKTYGAEAFLSKGFGPVMPYVAVGRMRLNAHGTINLPAGVKVALHDQSEVNRFTVGARFSLLLPKIVIEATQAETRSYAAKISIGF